MFDVKAFDVERFDALLARGLSKGVGDPSGQMCIEAAICHVLGLPHGDDPGCVAGSVRSYKIILNDGPWSSPEVRAAGLRDLGLAQLGSRDVVSDQEFEERVALKTVQRLIPTLFREVFTDLVCLRSADMCEAATDLSAAASAAESAASAAAWDAASAAWAAASAAAWAASAAAWDAESAAWAASAAAWAASDKYLRLSASLALETLRELNSPGCALLEDA